MLMAVPFAKIDRVFLTRHLTYIFSSSQCFIDGLFELFENLSRQDQKYPSVPFKSPIRNTQVGQPPFLLGMSRHDSVDSGHPEKWFKIAFLTNHTLLRLWNNFANGYLQKKRPTVRDKKHANFNFRFNMCILIWTNTIFGSICNVKIKSIKVIFISVL